MDKKRGNKTLEVGDLFNIHCPDFNPDLCLNQLLKEYNVSQLMEKEDHLRRQIQNLDNDMQTLVYENYNKFINATKTIRKMSINFDKMEEELKQLSINMENITAYREKISFNLQARRQDLMKLSATDAVLKKLQFLFDLPTKIKSSMDEKKYVDSVRFYFSAEDTLKRYCHFSSIQAIDKECTELLDKIKKILYSNLEADESNPRHMSQSIHLLLELNESPNQLSNYFLSCSKGRLIGFLDQLEVQAKNCAKKSSDPREQQDILEFMDLGSNGFLSNLMSIITSYFELFGQQLSLSVKDDNNYLIENVKLFVDELMASYFCHIKSRLSLEPFNFLEIAFFVRALDRLYRRLQNLSKVFIHRNYTEEGFSLIKELSDTQCFKAMEVLKSKYMEDLTNARHAIISITTHETKGQSVLSEILVSLEANLSESIKNSIKSLNAFLSTDISFLIKTDFQNTFVKSVREKVVIPILKFIISTSSEYYKKSTPIPLLILLLSRLNLDLDISIVSYLINFTDEHLVIPPNERSNTPLNDLKCSARQCAQNLINHYVGLEGHNISQMIKKSIETRDWSSSVEPRSVRSVMKRIVEDVSLIDSQVAQLYEEGPRTDRSSDSSRSRMTFSAIGIANKSTKSSWNSYGANQIDTSFINNIQKLFSERIDVFSPVEFSKLSIVTGIIKIGLKTFLECVRICTFSKFGLQQVQVDSYYLQTHLWRFVTDENLVHNMLEEVLISSVHRCVEPVMMEMNIVDKLCDGL